jgi:AcrR family transcriptional regulator
MTFDRREKPRRRRDVEADAARRDARREEFLAAAITVIRREGAGASMEAIAREAGVTKPILYRVFGDREGLLIALGDNFAAELVQELDQVLLAGGDPRATLSQGISAYVDLVERDLHIYRFLTARQSTEHHGPTGGYVERIAQTISVVMGERMLVDGVDSGATEPWSYGLVGMVHMTVDWWMERRTIPKERMVEYLVTLLWEGLGSTTEGWQPDVGGEDEQA